MSTRMAEVYRAPARLHATRGPITIRERALGGWMGRAAPLPAQDAPAVAADNSGQKVRRLRPKGGRQSQPLPVRSPNVRA